MFNLFINDIFENLKPIFIDKCLLFADNIMVFGHSETIVNEIAAEINEYVIKNYLKINIDKSVYITSKNIDS